MGHTGNRCQTEYGAATWRTTRRWRRCAVSDCFLVLHVWHIWGGRVQVGLLPARHKPAVNNIQRREGRLENGREVHGERSELYDASLWSDDKRRPAEWCRLLRLLRAFQFSQEIRRAGCTRYVVDVVVIVALLSDILNTERANLVMLSESSFACCHWHTNGQCHITNMTSIRQQCPIVSNRAQFYTLYWLRETICHSRCHLNKDPRLLN